MSIFSRMTDIINSNLNALLDKAEDPEKMVRLIIQEMEETLVEVRTTSARTIADKKELVRRRDWLKEEAGEWERKAEVAIRKGRDDLARAALVERNKASEGAESATRELQIARRDPREAVGGHRRSCRTRSRTRRPARTRSSCAARRPRRALGVKRQLNDANLDDAIQRFEQYERKMDDLEGQIEAFDLGQRTLADEIKELEGGEKIDEDLKALKVRVGGGQSRRAAFAI